MISNNSLSKSMCASYLQSSKMSHDHRLTVVRPSFDCRSKLLKLVTVLALLLTIGSGNVWGADSGLTASPGVFILDFYNSEARTTTGGTALTLANCTTHVKVPSGITAGDVVTNVSTKNNARYDMNGGLTLGKGSNQDSQATLTIGSNFPVRKITVVGTLYGTDAAPLYVAGTSITLNAKQSTYANCSSSTIITPSPFITSININNNSKKRSTLYTAVCEYGYRTYLTTPAEGAISAAPKTANENGAGWNGTEGAVVGLKSGQKVTLSVTTNPSGKVFDSWTVKKKSDNSDITATVLDGNTLTMPAYDVTVSVTWASASSCGVPTVGAPSNSSVSVNTATVSCTGITKNDCDIEEWGFYYKTGSSGVTTSDTKHQVSAASSSTSVGSYSWDMTSLTANTHYYVKAYAIVDGVTTLSSSETDFTTCKVAAPNHVDITPTAEAGNYGYRYTIGETIKLTATAYASEGTGSPISSTNITGYQWQKYKGSAFVDIEDGLDATDGGTFSGTNSANLQIIGCTSSNTGSYRCVINTGASCSKESSGYMVYVYTLDGAYYGNSKTQNAITWTGEKTGTVTLSLNASSTYMFKVKDNDQKEYGREANNFIIEPWQQDCNTNNQDIRLFTGPAGTYTFTIDITNAQAGTPVANVKVDYPDVTHPVTGYMYVPKWWTCYPHWWDNSSNALTANGSDPAITKYTTICGEDYWYMPVLDNYVNVAVKDNATWASASNNSGNQTTTSHSGMLLTNHGSGWVWEAFPAYTISFDKGAGSGTMSSITDITGGANQLLPANSFTKTGYDFDGWIADVDVKISGSTVTEGTKFSGGVTLQEICGDVALTAQWVANSYDVTLKKNGGASVADQVVSATYDSDMPLVVKTAGTDIVVPSRNGYTFQGYWDTSESSGGTQYYSYSGTPAVLASARAWDKTSATNLYGRWSANVYTVTLDNQSATTAGAASVSATFGQAMPSIASNLPSKTGYRFDGYYTAKNGGGTKYYNANGSSATSMGLYGENPTLYANWVAQLTFSVNGVIEDELTRDDNTAMPSTAAVPTACGDCWAFMGWSTDPDEDGSGTIYAGGAINNFGTPTTLYAVYGKTVYQLIEGTSDLETNAYYVLTTLDIDGYEYALNSTLSGNYGTSTDVYDDVVERGGGYYLYNIPANLIWKFTGTAASGRLYNESTAKYVDLTGGALFKASTSDNLNFTIPDATYSEFNIASVTTSTNKLHIYNDTEWGPTSSATGVYMYKRTSAEYATEPSCETYAITWMVNGVAYTTGSPTEETNTCTGIETLPTAPSNSTLDCADKFMGWSEYTLIGTGQSAPADLFISAKDAPIINENKTFHAVFAKGEAGGSGSVVLSYTSLGLTTSYESGSTKTVSGIDFNCNDIMTGTSGQDGYQKIQFKKSSTGPGYLYNSEAMPGNITSIVFESTTRNLTVNFGASSNPDGSAETTTCSSGSTTATPTGNYQYFKITNAEDNAAYTGTITINYTDVTYNSYVTSCCDKNITLSDPTITDAAGSGATITFDKSSPVATCGGETTVTATLTLPAGYEATALSFSGGSVSVSPEISLPVTATTVYTLTFDANTNATLTTTATVAAKTATAWTWTYNSGAIPDPLVLYVGINKQLDVTYTPADLLNGQKNYTVTKTDAHVSQGGKAYDYYTMRGAPGVTTETNSTVTFSLNGLSQTVNVTVKPQPKVYFVDIVHNETFDPVMPAVASYVANFVQQTPTHADVAEPGTGNTCEKQHLHLIGWIRSDYSKVEDYLNGTGAKPSITELTDAGTDGEGLSYYFEPNADINVEAYNGLTFYAVWAKVE